MPGEPVRAALWLRVSTTEQEAANQRPGLEALAERRGWAVVASYELTGESAWSGAGGYRQAVAAMVADAKAARFDVLAAWSLDRLTRGGPLEALKLLDRLGRSGVQVVTVQEPWLEVGPEFRDVLVALVGWVARWESDRRSERTRAGMDAPGPRGSGSGGRQARRTRASASGRGTSPGRPGSTASRDGRTAPGGRLPRRPAGTGAGGVFSGLENRMSQRPDTGSTGSCTGRSADQRSTLFGSWNDPLVTGAS